MAVLYLTASHNPKEWNALKLLNAKGEFLDAIEGAKILDIAESDSINFSDVDSLGKIRKNEAYFDLHIMEVLDLPLVTVKAIKEAKFRVVVDGVNSTGGIVIPLLLERLGVDVIKIVLRAKW